VIELKNCSAYIGLHREKRNRKKLGQLGGGSLEPGGRWLVPIELQRALFLMGRGKKRMRLGFVCHGRKKKKEVVGRRGKKTPDCIAEEPTVLR